MKYKQAHDRLSACNANQNCKLCEEGWKSLGLKCYYFLTNKLTWTQSRDYCVEKGGHLVIITSQTEQDFVSSQIKETHWIGLNDLETEGKWRFWYRSPAGIDEPDNWKKEDPSGENCASLGHEIGETHKWSSIFSAVGVYVSRSDLCIRTGVGWTSSGYVHAIYLPCLGFRDFSH
ncbi:hypothetical protein PHYPO_G00170650 [Pangasianodon hypophthalmus]|uniref:C-type lectin domain-containing protein n=1 Tax=Pangasianodon hypophthalmus TaxID=310915 RepID=A0A5N5JEP9_PANHP|nr:hypothetical protein PHYPO_G00170650 [Pangasianodon hypophthalmus]